MARHFVDDVVAFVERIPRVCPRLVSYRLCRLAASERLGTVSMSLDLALTEIIKMQSQIMLRSRDFEFDEPKLKEAYNLLLRVAGIFNAVLSWLGSSSSTAPTELSEDNLAQWRAEQSRAGNPDIQSLQRVKDFENGTLCKILHGVALAQAQELVLLRGVTKEVVDWVLMGKLAMDISRRYGDLCPPAKWKPWLDWKMTYYVGLSSYYQGVAEWAKNDGNSCAQAIAQFQSAKEQLSPLQNKEVERSKAIIDRDLDIATARNRSVYLEQVPAPQPPLDPVSLVQVQSFQPVHPHSLWDEAAHSKSTLAGPSTTSSSAPAAPPVQYADTSSGCSCAVM
ncbi:hypothetical protein, variant 2 [Aphanomyces invadans]|uniref:BRO1 domain-containing protein n=1 Tax=Aphanomyces invadans TaxID=157072 RepID=A0A024TFW0_9STRA|nr:hypothetical protein, variant 2 [Aphanomyces invadans]ETV92471.1 hypothetical protein, variant 2 [Aphanomyces invadans]|eukprot:XP_008878778.1 hypothetical protein, variant 2 [Aphanomyces invadans]